MALDWALLWDEKNDGLLWANPPWTKIEQILVKAALDGVQLVLLTPDWTSQDWRALLGVITVRRCTIPTTHGLFAADTGPLPAPKWDVLVSQIDGKLLCSFGRSVLKKDLASRFQKLNRHKGRTALCHAEDGARPSNRPPFATQVGEELP